MISYDIVDDKKRTQVAQGAQELRRRVHVVKAADKILAAIADHYRTAGEEEILAGPDVA